MKKTVKKTKTTKNITAVTKKPLQTEIFEYVVKPVQGKRQKVGVLYATVKYVKPLLDHERPVVHIGWSKANMKKGDRFDRIRGIKLAKERANSRNFIPAPQSLEGDIMKFASRCWRYFKGVETMHRLYFTDMTGGRNLKELLT